ncbi:MAG: hypothetical protein ACK56I_23210, partial [bacterium]
MSVGWSVVSVRLGPDVALMPEAPARSTTEVARVAQCIQAARSMVRGPAGGRSGRPSAFRAELESPFSVSPFS